MAQNQLLTDSELDAIIDAPRDETGLSVQHLDCYFDTMKGSVEPSWKYMDRVRMKELFRRFLKCGWIKPHQVDKIEAALCQL